MESRPTFHPGIAAVLSLVIPGAGQIYGGSITAGLIWLIVTTPFYVGAASGYTLMIVPAVILHVICLVTAAQPPSVDGVTKRGRGDVTE